MVARLEATVRERSVAFSRSELFETGQKQESHLLFFFSPLGEKVTDNSQFSPPGENS